MSTLIPKHLKKSPIWERYSPKQYISSTTGILVVDEAIAKTKQLQNLRNRLRHKGASSKIGAASPATLNRIDKKELNQLSDNERKLFAQWLFDEGAGNHESQTFTPFAPRPNDYLGSINLTKIGNAFATGINALMSFFGIPASNIATSDGLKLQAIALHLFDNNDITKSNDTIYHILGNDKNNNYKWQQLNGGRSTSSNRSLIDRASNEPGTYILGRYKVTETPSDYIITDPGGYDFNQAGTDVALALVDAGNADLYQWIRAKIGTHGKNKPIPVHMTVSKDYINKKLLQYLNQ